MDGTRPSSRTRLPPWRPPETATHVTKIGLGIITPIKSGPEHLKFTPVSGGLKMQVRGAHAVQVFWLHTTRPDDVIEEITRKWDQR